MRRCTIKRFSFPDFGKDYELKFELNPSNEKEKKMLNELMNDEKSEEIAGSIL
jgi:hypothetical protein